MAPLILATGDSYCLKQSGHIVAEAEPILMGEEHAKSLVMLPMTHDMDTFIHDLSLGVKIRHWSLIKSLGFSPQLHF